jgi:peptidylprolyl isomerase
MKFRLLAILMLGLSLLAAPVLAKDKPVITPPADTLPTFVDPDPTHDPQDVVYLDLSNGGRVAIRLMPKWAPNHVERIKTLVRQHFYDGLTFHRVIDGFMAQTGDPTGTGEGGSSLPNLKAEFNSMPHLRGTVSMARTDDPDSANSQFFIMFYPRFALDHHYTVFGRVISGMDAVDKIARGEPPANPTKIVHAWLASDPVPAPTTASISTPQPEAPVSVDQLNHSKSE